MTTGTVTLGGAVSANTLNFKNGATAISGNFALTLANGITVDAGLTGLAAIGNAGTNTSVTVSAPQTWANNVSGSTNRLIIGRATLNGLVTIAGAGTVQLGNDGTSNSLGGSGDIQIGTSTTAGFVGWSTSSNGIGTGNDVYLVNGSIVGGGASAGNSRIKGFNNSGTFFLQGDFTFAGTSDTNSVIQKLALDTNSVLNATNTSQASFPLLIARVDDGALNPNAIFTKSGASTVSITTTNSTYSGGTVLQGGTLRIAGDGSLGAVPGAAATNITFDSNATLQTTADAVVSLNANRNVSIANAAVGTFNTTSGAAQNLIVNGKISGLGGLGKSGTGLVTLNGANDYSGGTTLSGGTLAAGNNSAFGAGTINATGGYTIQSSDTTNRSLGNNVTFTLSSGTITLSLGASGTGNLAFGTFSGAGSGGARILAINNAQTSFTDFTGTFGFSTSGTGALFFSGAYSSTTGGVGIGNSNMVGFINGVPTDANRGNISVNNGGVLGTNGTLTRTLGTSGSNTRFLFSGSGGFAGYGTSGTFGNASNNLAIQLNNGTSTMTFGTTTSFLASGQALVLGNTHANGIVDFQNGLNFNGVVQTVKVDRSASAGASDIDAKLSGVLTNGALTKTGVGTLELTNNNTYAGDTLVTAGTLLVNNTTGSGTGSGAVTVQSGGTLGGIGTISGAVTVQSGGTLSPGNSPGNQTLGSLVLNDGGNYNWQILDATGVAGTGYDTYTLSGSLDLSALTTTFNINLWSLESIGPDVNGNAANFNNGLDQSWTLVATGNAISSFNASRFAVNVGATNGTGGFTNGLGGGTFSVGLSVDNTDLMLNYTAIPEPSTWALLAFSLTTAVVLRRRRK